MNYSKSLRKRLNGQSLSIGNIVVGEAVNFYIKVSSDGFGLTQQQADLVKQLCTAAEKRKILISKAAYKEKQPVGIFLAIRSKQRIFNLFSISNHLGKQYLAQHVFVDAVIREYSEQPLTLDFEGSEIPGVHAFNRQFGATIEPYPMFTCFKNKAIERLYSLWRKPIEK